MRRKKNNKVDYFVCAVYYCMCLEDIRFDKIIDTQHERNYECCACAENFFRGICFCYYSSLPMGLLMFLGVQKWYSFLLSIVLCIIMERPIYKHILESGIRIKLFKQFEKKDGRWLWKWRGITVMFCITAVIILFLSMFLIIHCSGYIGQTA